MYCTHSGPLSRGSRRSPWNLRAKSRAKHHQLPSLVRAGTLWIIGVLPSPELLHIADVLAFVVDPILYASAYSGMSCNLCLLVLHSHNQSGCSVGAAMVFMFFVGMTATLMMVVVLFRPYRVWHVLCMSAGLLHNLRQLDSQTS